MTVKGLLVAGALLLAASLVSTTSGSSGAQDKVDYATQLRPILEVYCYECHGADEARREADFRVDQKSGAFADLGGYLSIVPGKPNDSELYLRVSADFAEDRMPPYDSGVELTKEEIETIRMWIVQGAEWPDD